MEMTRDTNINTGMRRMLIILLNEYIGYGENSLKRERLEEIQDWLHSKEERLKQYQ